MDGNHGEQTISSSRTIFNKRMFLFFSLNIYYLCLATYIYIR